jgi:pimeloyl-ACP methyl ester carboxylesterase
MAGSPIPDRPGHRRGVVCCVDVRRRAQCATLVKTLADFVRSRPAQPLDDFLRESDAVISHDCLSNLSRIEAPTQITFGRFDMACSTRFADALHGQIKGSELHVFEDCSHAPIYENVDAFNHRTLAFLQQHTG